MPPHVSSPHAAIVPLLVNAAKAKMVADTTVKPVPKGAPLPPPLLLPHAEIEPSAANAAKASSFA